MNGQAVCSCLPSFVGVPPRCRPECVSNSECPQDQVCVNQRCQDPCPGTCGLQAKCYVNNHNPICTCPPSYTGNPFFRCYPDLPRKSFCLLRYFVLLKSPIKRFFSLQLLFLKRHHHLLIRVYLHRVVQILYVRSRMTKLRARAYLNSEDSLHSVSQNVLVIQNVPVI